MVKCRSASSLEAILGRYDTVMSGPACLTAKICAGTANTLKRVRCPCLLMEWPQSKQTRAAPCPPHECNRCVMHPRSLKVCGANFQLWSYGKVKWVGVFIATQLANVSTPIAQAASGCLADFARLRVRYGEAVRVLQRRQRAAAEGSLQIRMPDHPLLELQTLHSWQASELTRDMSAEHLRAHGNQPSRPCTPAAKYVLGPGICPPLACHCCGQCGAFRRLREIQCVNPRRQNLIPYGDLSHRQSHLRCAQLSRSGKLLLSGAGLHASSGTHCCRGQHTEGVGTHEDWSATDTQQGMPN